MLFHGVNISEVATNVLPPREVSAAIPFVVGAAPVHRSASASADVLNKPVLCNTYEEFITAFGSAPSDQWGKYTLSEFAYVFFGLYGVGPAIFVNVLDPADGTAITAEAAVLVAGSYTLQQDAVLSTLVVKSQDGLTTYDITDDYTAVLDDDGYIVITRVSTGTIPAATTPLTVDYKKIAAAPVVADDIIGGVSAGGANLGLQCIEDVYPLHSLVPGMILAPGFSQDVEVAAAMVAKCQGINSLFSCICIVDIDSASATGADLYTEVNAWKNTNNFTSPYMYVCWPKVKLGTVKYWMSSHLAGRIASTDADNDNVPYVSPSNKAFQINGLSLADGSDVILSIPKADTLNQQGVTTGLMFNGWKCWGNRTGAYPGSTDPKDAFACIRRMFNWVGNNVVLLLWQKLDDPLNRRTIETALDSVNQWLNGLISRGALNAGRMEFVQADNSNVNLAAGKARFRLYLTPPSAAEQISVVLEYDVNGNSAVFG
jgi:hypothetical protein